MNINNLKSMLSLGMRVADRRKPCEGLISFPETKPPFAPKPLRRYPFPHALPEEVGASSGHIAGFLRELAGEKSVGIQSVLIAKDGKLIADASFGPYRSDVWKNTFSECKSVTGLAIGLLYDEGKLTPEEKLTDIFPDRIPTLQKLMIAPMTVRHLLTMTSQISFNEGESMTSGNWVRSFLTSSLRGPVGGEFHYNSLNSFLLSAIVREKSGMSLSDYLREKLFDPMGIENFYWEKSPEGIEKGGWGLYILPEDMLKLGELMRCRGEWKGRRLLSEKWIGMMTTGYEDAPSTAGYFRYGFQMWVGKENGAWLFNGMYGQNMLIYPGTGYVIVSNASNSDMFQQGAYFPLCDRYFSKPAAKTEEGSAEALASLIASFKPAIPLPEKHHWLSLFRKEKPAPLIPQSAMAFAGKSFVPVKKDFALGLMPRMMQAVQNDFTAGLDKLSFIYEKNAEGRETFCAVFEEGERRISLPLSFGVPESGNIPIGAAEWLVSAPARAAKNEDSEPVLIFDALFLETPFARSFRLTLHEDGATLRADEKPGKEFITSFASSMGEDLVRNPVVESALSRVDRDYIDYKLDTLFRPTVELSEE